MPNCCSNTKKYMFAFALGAVGGGLMLAIATKAILKMMPKMMQSMMSHMGGEGCSPAEM